MTVLQWTSEWADHGIALSETALRAGKEPGACYRLVKRISGRSWKDVREAGPDWVLAEFLADCTMPTRKPQSAFRRSLVQRAAAG